MSTFPRLAAFRPLASGHPALMAKYDIVCLHTMVGYLTSTERMFRENGWSGTESHFGVGGPWGDNRDGEAIQWVDTRYRADANLNGNHRIISIETGDNAPALARQLMPWTERQLDKIVELVAAICTEHNIPPVLIRDSKPGSRGIGWHRLGIEHSEGVGAVPGYLVRGGERWSNSIGKECPGNARVNQMREIESRVQKLLNPPPIERDWSDMAISKPSDVWKGADVDLIPHEDPVTREPTDPENPLWQPVSVIGETNRVVRGSAEELKLMKNRITGLELGLNQANTTLAEILKRLPPTE
jgi:N-acetylmuramoyl-L-alanine amidase